MVSIISAKFKLIRNAGMPGMQQKSGIGKILEIMMNNHRNYCSIRRICVPGVHTTYNIQIGNVDVCENIIRNKNLLII